MYEVTVICVAVIVCTALLCFKGVTVHYTDDTPAARTDVVHLRKLFEAANEENNKGSEEQHTPNFSELLDALDSTYEEGLDYANEPKE